MIIRRSTAAVGLTAIVGGAGLITATPASAGGIGDFLSPAFGSNCANQNTGAHAAGETRQGTGIAGGNLAGLPVGTPFNQCGGADLPGVPGDTSRSVFGLGLKIGTELQGALNGETQVLGA
ncbi:chaplin family protein [Streptomyces albidochromogenes]|uniref:Chaplin family protein n=1 Tax=Streptomyces albidochromogenes TaxID=329524 RepID=A0ABW6FII7_9ACTN